MRKIRKGDVVQVIAGRDSKGAEGGKGKRGKVLRVLESDEGTRVVVEGVNIHKHHVKPNAAADRQGGIIPREAPLDISNVALVSPTTGKPVRVGITTIVDANGLSHKVRVVHKTGEILDQI